MIDYIKSLKNNLKIRDELKDSTYNISRSESKKIKKTLYNTEKRNKIGSKKTKRYLDELDKKYVNWINTMITMIMNIKE